MARKSTFNNAFAQRQAPQPERVAAPAQKPSAVAAQNNPMGGRTTSFAGGGMGANPAPKPPVNTAQQQIAKSMGGGGWAAPPQVSGQQVAPADKPYWNDGIKNNNPNNPNNPNGTGYDPGNPWGGGVFKPPGLPGPGGVDGHSGGQNGGANDPTPNGPNWGQPGGGIGGIVQPGGGGVKPPPTTITPPRTDIYPGRPNVNPNEFEGGSIGPGDARYQPGPWDNQPQGGGRPAQGGGQQPVGANQGAPFPGRGNADRPNTGPPSVAGPMGGPGDVGGAAGVYTPGAGDAGGRPNSGNGRNLDAIRKQLPPQFANVPPEQLERILAELTGGKGFPGNGNGRGPLQQWGNAQPQRRIDKSPNGFGWSGNVGTSRGGGGYGASAGESRGSRTSSRRRSQRRAR